MLKKLSGSPNQRNNFENFQTFRRSFGEDRKRLAKDENVWGNLGNVWRGVGEFHKFGIRQYRHIVADPVRSPLNGETKLYNDAFHD